MVAVPARNNLRNSYGKVIIGMNAVDVVTVPPQDVTNVLEELYRFWREVYVSQARYVDPKDWDKYIEDDLPTTLRSFLILGYANVPDRRIVCSLRVVEYNPALLDGGLPIASHFPGLVIPRDMKDRKIAEVGKAMKTKDIEGYLLGEGVMTLLYLHLARFGLENDICNWVAFIIPGYFTVLSKFGIQFEDLRYDRINPGWMKRYFDLGPKPVAFDFFKSARPVLDRSTLLSKILLRTLTKENLNRLRHASHLEKGERAASLLASRI